MSFTSVTEIVLGEDRDEQIGYMGKILGLGFPNGIIAYCPKCNTADEMTIAEAAAKIVDAEWPRCHDKRMLMETPEGIPPF